MNLVEPLVNLTFAFNGVLASTFLSVQDSLEQFMNERSLSPWLVRFFIYANLMLVVLLYCWTVHFFRSRHSDDSQPNKTPERSVLEDFYKEWCIAGFSSDKEPDLSIEDLEPNERALLENFLPEYKGIIDDCDIVFDRCLKTAEFSKAQSQLGFVSDRWVALDEWTNVLERQLGRPFSGFDYDAFLDCFRDSIDQRTPITLFAYAHPTLLLDNSGIRRIIRQIIIIETEFTNAGARFKWFLCDFEISEEDYSYESEAEETK